MLYFAFLRIKAFYISKLYEYSQLKTFHLIKILYNVVRLIFFTNCKRSKLPERYSLEP